MPNPIPISIPEGSKSDCIIRERIFNSNLFTVPKQGTNIRRTVINSKRSNSYNAVRVIGSSSYLFKAVKTCTSNVEGLQGIRHSLLRRSFNLRLKEIIIIVLSTLPSSGIDIAISNLPLPVPLWLLCCCPITFHFPLYCCYPRKLAGLKWKLIALKNAVIPFRMYTRQTNDFHSQYVKSEISHWLTFINQWNGKEISLFSSYYYVLTADESELGAGATPKKGNKVTKTWYFKWSTTQLKMSSI
ncbi:hypothetical protein ACTFIW_001022 [Dictyostelium discoideum]